MGFEVDWSYREQYMLARHGITVTVANEALNDPDRLELNPDPASKQGLSVRTIGWSPTHGKLISVLTVIEDGITYGLNGFESDHTDRRKYRKEGQK